MAGLWVIRMAGGTGGKWGDVGMGKWGSPPEKVWWLPVLLIFYSFIIIKFLYNLILYEFL